MDNVAVTGCAGFIGFHTTRLLLKEGYHVTGIDNLNDYYDPRRKEANLAALSHENFAFVKGDINDLDLEPLVRDAGVIHLAGRGGVRQSWEDFSRYVNDNILATKRLLDAALAGDVSRLVYASSSSVYGNAETPFRETARPEPISPYGITKLAAEHLTRTYPFSTTALRYFTVYGPRQREDMAFSRFIAAILDEQPLPLYGDGTQTRDFTFVEDIAHANVLALRSKNEGVYNIGGGARVSMRDVITVLEENTGKKAKVNAGDAETGDVRHTHADTSKAREELGYVPGTSLKEGLRRQVDWVISEQQR